MLDLSGSAIKAARTRLGRDPDLVHWIEGDVLTCKLPEHSFDILHDRAVFHFLTAEADRIAYREQVLRALKPGRYLIIGTFAEDGPEKCSGLSVMRYSPEQLSAVLGNSFTLLLQEDDYHRTPSGTVHHFVFCTFKLTGISDNS